MRGCVRVFKCETGQTIPPNLGSALYWLERHLFCSLCKQINIPCLIFAFFHHTNLVSIHTVPCWTHGIYGTGGQECLHVHLSWWETHAAYSLGWTISFFPDKNFAIWCGSGLIWLERPEETCCSSWISGERWEWIMRRTHTHLWSGCGWLHRSQSRSLAGVLLRAFRSELSAPICRAITFPGPCSPRLQSGSVGQRSMCVSVCFPVLFWSLGIISSRMLERTGGR